MANTPRSLSKNGWIAQSTRKKEFAYNALNNTANITTQIIFDIIIRGCYTPYEFLLKHVSDLEIEKKLSKKNFKWDLLKSRILKTVHNNDWSKYFVRDSYPI